MTPETQNVEWKRSWRDEHLKWICGFANAQGGVLEIGKVVGVEGVLRLLEEIPGKVQSLLGIVVDVNLKSESGREYLEVAVEPHPNPISYKGEFHYRSGTTQKTAQKSAGTTRISTRDRIVDCLRAEPGLTRLALAERVGLSPDGVRYHLQNLKAAGVIRRIGSDRAGHWEVLR